MRLILLSVAITTALGAAGYWPTSVLAGPGGAKAMCLGLGLALLASVAGLLPAAWTLRLPPSKHASGLLLGMAIRFLLVLGLLLAALLSGIEQKLTLALWAVIGHLTLLVVGILGLPRGAGVAGRCVP